MHNAPMHANTAAHKFRFTTSSSHLLHRLLLNSRRAEWRLLEARLSAFVHMRTCTHADASACTQILFRHFIISSSSSSPLLLKAQRGALLLSAFECVRAHMHPCTHECCCTQISFHHFIIFIFIFFLEARLSLSACAHMRTCTHAHTSGAAHKFRFTISSSSSSSSSPLLLKEGRMALVGSAHMRTCTHAHTSAAAHKFRFTTSSSSMILHLLSHWKRVF